MRGILRVRGAAHGRSAVGGRRRRDHRRFRTRERRASAVHGADPAARPARAAELRVGAGARRRTGAAGCPRRPAVAQRRARRGPRALGGPGGRVRCPHGHRECRCRRAGECAASRGGDRGLRPRRRGAEPRPAACRTVDRREPRLLGGVRLERSTPGRHPGGTPSRVGAPPQRTGPAPRYGRVARPARPGVRRLSTPAAADAAVAGGHVGGRGGDHVHASDGREPFGRGRRPAPDGAVGRAQPVAGRGASRIVTALSVSSCLWFP